MRIVSTSLVMDSFYKVRYMDKDHAQSVRLHILSPNLQNG
jgi:hypothetical protein